MMWGWMMKVIFKFFGEVRLGRRSLTPKNDFHVNLYVFHLMKFFLRLNHNINNVFDAEGGGHEADQNGAGWVR